MLQKSPQGSPPVESTGCIAGLVRTTWLLFGNVVPLFLAVFIAQGSGFSNLDLVFWASVVGLSLARYIDITRLNGLTASGEPATLRHWRRHTVLLLLASAAVWVLAHLV